MAKKQKSKFKAETEEDDDENEWVEEKAPEEKKPEKDEHEQHAQMPENKPGEAPPDPKDQPPVVPNYDLSPNNPVPPLAEEPDKPKAKKKDD